MFGGLDDCFAGFEEGYEYNEWDSDGATKGLLDLEASEGTSDRESDADQSSDDGDYLDCSFPQFMHMPPEIREMVWAAFCPDLGSEPRVFDLALNPDIRRTRYLHLPDPDELIVAGGQIESQTESIRTVMAVHRESRALGLKSAPHELLVSDEEVVRYHKERDVLFVSADHLAVPGIARRFQQQGIEAENLAFPRRLCVNYAQKVADLPHMFPYMRRLFILADEERDLRGFGSRNLTWVVSDMVNKYHLDTEEEGEFGFPRTISCISCWPDLDNHRQFAEEHVMLLKEGVAVWRMVQLYRDRLNEKQDEAVKPPQSIEVWPMVRFSFQEGVERFHDIGTRLRLCPDDLSDSVSSGYYTSDDDESSWHDSVSAYRRRTNLLALGTEDEYESDGTDDTHQAFVDDSDGIDGLSHMPGDSSVDEDDELLIQLAHRLTQPSEGSDESATETDQSTRPSNQRPRAAISDLEDGNEEEPVRGRKWRARAVQIDSDDENELGNSEPSRAGRRRGRAVVFDEDDEGEEGGEEEVEEEVEEAQQPSVGRRARRRVVQDDSDDEDNDGESTSEGGAAETDDSDSHDKEASSSNDEDDDPPPPKRVSLAKRLCLESRQRRPRRIEDDDSEANDMNSDGDSDGDGDGYSDDQEDEADGSDSGMMAGVDRSSDGEDGDSEEGY